MTIHGSDVPEVPTKRGETRRLFLAMLAMAGLSTFGRPPGAEAARKRKKRKRGKAHVKATCQSQAEQCASIYAADCEGNAECVAEGEQCCPFARTCDITGYLDCVFGNIIIG